MKQLALATLMILSALFAGCGKTKPQLSLFMDDLWTQLKAR